MALYAVNRRFQCIVVCHYQEMGYEQNRMVGECIVAQLSKLLGSAICFAM